LGSRDNRGKKGQDTELLETLEAFYKTEYQPLLNHVKTNLKNTTFLLPYLATQIHTSLSNNTQEHFIQHFLRFINKTTNEITEDKAILFQFKKNLMELSETNEIFNEWKETHLPNILPIEIKKSVHYDVKVKPFDYLKGMLYMNSVLEKMESKLFQPLPLRNNIIPKHIIIDTASLISLFCPAVGGNDKDGNPVLLKDIWPTAQEIQSVIDSSISSEMFKKDYASVFDGDHRWKSLDTPTGKTFEWDPKSTYVRKPPYFDGMPAEPKPVTDIAGARVLAILGDSVTTDHISPAGNIKADSPAGKYLEEHAVDRKDFNSYGSRRGNHEVMIRGTFANIRLKNLLLDGVEGGFTRNFLNAGAQSTIYDASVAYQAASVGLVILAGKEYGSGSSRDWAAKGTALLGVRAVIAESFERIHRSNLIGMGVLPLQFVNGENAQSLGIKGDEVFTISGVTALNNGEIPREVTVTAGDKTFTAKVRIDTPGEADYYRHGGIMQYVLRQLRG
jgi:3-isopropylmalate dehydratase small subunit